MTIDRWMDHGIELVTTCGWVSTVILGSAFLVNRLAKDTSPARKFFLWQIAFISLWAIPLTFLLLPTLAIGDLMATVPPTSDAASESSSIREALLPIPPRFQDRDQASMPLPIAVRRANEPVRIPSYQAKSTNLESRQPLTNESVANPIWISAIPSPLRLLFLVWLTVAIGFQGRLVQAVFRLHLVRRNWEPITLDGNADQIPRYWAPEATVPFTCGLFRPCIVLPDSARQWSKERLEITIEHELAHIRRKDVAIQLVVASIRNLLWFQPLAWKGMSEMRRLRELACDDQVLTRGIVNHRYAEILLQSVCDANLSTAAPELLVTMAEKPIQERIVRVLDGRRSRRPVSNIFRWSLATVVLITAACLTTLRPFPANGNIEVVTDSAIRPAEKRPLPSAPPAQELPDETSSLPEFLSGTLLNSEGEPVSNARLRGKIVIQQVTETTPVQVQSHLIPEVRTNPQGEFQLPTTGIKLSEGRAHFAGFAQADGYADLPLAFSIKGPDFTVPKLSFRPSRKVSGRVVAADGNTPLKNPTVTFIGEGTGPTLHWESAPIVCEADGSFTTWVPRHGRLEVHAFADNRAPRTRQISPHQNALTPIELLPGPRVVGKVIRKDGQPAAGILVEIRRQPSRTIGQLEDNAIFQEPTRVTRTDAQGRYEFSPCRGVQVVTVRENALHMDPELSQYSESQQPLIAPVKLPLDNSDSVTACDLVEQPPLTVAGTIRWADRTPASDILVRVGLGSGLIATLSQTRTDVQGNYRLEIPPAAESVHVFVSRLQREGVTHSAHSDTNQPDHQNDGSMTFLDLNESLTDVDWVLRPWPTLQSRPEVPPPRSEEDIAFGDLERKHYGNRSVDQPVDLPALHQDLLEFEKRHRGSHAALVALWHVLNDGETETIRDQARARIQQHYIQHPSADMVAGVLLGSELLVNGDPDQRSRNLAIVQSIQQQNPEPATRAATIHAELMHLQDYYFYREALERRNWEFPGADRFQDLSEAETQQVDRIVSEIRKMDPISSRKRLQELIQQLRSEYWDVPAVSYVGGGVRYLNGRLASSEGVLKRDRRTGDLLKTYGDIGADADFQLNDLERGQLAPPLAARDSQGNPINWNHYQGKLTLLIIDSAYRSDFLDRQEQLVQLREQFLDQLQLVTLLSSEDNEEVRKALASRPNPWPVVFDGNTSPLTQRWRRDDSFSDIVVIGRQGRIVGHLSFQDELEREIARLMK